MKPEKEKLELTPELKKRFENTLVRMATNDTFAFYSHMLFSMDLELSDKCPTARVKYNKRRFKIQVNPKFMYEYLPDDKTTDKNGNTILSEIQRLVVLAHEVSHPLYLHNMRRDDRDPKIWNYAGDLVINQHLFTHLPDKCELRDITVNVGSGMFKDLPLGLTAEQYYELIKDYDFPDDDEDDGDDGDDDPTDMSNDCESNSHVSEIEKEMIRQQFKQLAERAKNRCRGNVGADVHALLDFLTTPAVINWRDELRDVVGNKKTFYEKTIKRRDRRLPHRMDLQGTIKKHGFSLGVVGDESGSVSNDELASGLNEIKFICDDMNVPMWYVHCDTDASEPELFTSFEGKFERKRCGGTHMWPGVKKYLDSGLEIDALLIITDGEIEQSWPDVLNIPVIFLIVGNSDLSFDISVSPFYRKFRLEDYK